MESENAFIQEKLELWLSFNPRLALIGFRTTGHCILFSPLDRVCLTRLMH